MIHRSLVSLHNPHSVVYISLSRQPLQLHGAASDPRGDGAPGRGTLPGAGAQQQTPLREKLLLPQERHLHTVSPPDRIHFLRAPPLRHIVSRAPLEFPPLAIQRVACDTDRN